MAISPLFSYKEIVYIYIYIGRSQSNTVYISIYPPVKIPWTEGPDGLQSMDFPKSWTQVSMRWGIE